MNDVCKLCKEETELRYSHILPEFFYSGIYDELHRTLEITHNDERTIQKGIREFLLCQNCETKLSRYETYAARLIRDIPEFRRDGGGRFVYSEGVDYLQFKLFQLSMIWRAGISKNPGFAQVNLGPHEEKVRRMLEEGNPGTFSQYGCIMMTMPNTELLHKILVGPIRLKPKLFGHTVYKFITGNITWLFFVTSHVVSKQAEELFLQETGMLRIWLASDETSLLVSLGKIMKEFGRG
jgi:hypothetical protein